MESQPESLYCLILVSKNGYEKDEPIIINVLPQDDNFNKDSQLELINKAVFADTHLAMTNLIGLAYGQKFSDNWFSKLDNGIYVFESYIAQVKNKLTDEIEPVLLKGILLHEMTMTDYGLFYR